MFDFNPRPPHGGRLGAEERISPATRISIHALLTEGDHIYETSNRTLADFNPRPPHGGRQLANRPQGR